MGRSARWSGSWYLRADRDGWAFQALATSGSHEWMLAGVKSGDPGAVERWGATPCGPGGVDLAAAWRLIEACEASHRAGELPLLGREPGTLHRGRSVPAWAALPGPRPEGALAGDPSRQNAGGYAPTFELYFDDERICRQCGEGFVFGAEEQRHWYEELRFLTYSAPVRCPRCRREAREHRAQDVRISRAHAAVHADRDSPEANLALARAVLEHLRVRGTGDPDRAIAAARRARTLGADAREARYWEARAQEAAGRFGKAARLDAQENA